MGFADRKIFLSFLNFISPKGGPTFFNKATLHTMKTDAIQWLNDIGINVNDTKTKYRNETKTFWCVPKKEVKRFYLVQKLWIEIITFWCIPEPFKSKSGCFYVV